VTINATIWGELMADHVRVPRAAPDPRGSGRLIEASPPCVAYGAGLSEVVALKVSDA
jgi:hypothetical protein